MLATAGARGRDPRDQRAAAVGTLRGRGRDARRRAAAEGDRAGARRRSRSGRTRATRRWAASFLDAPDGAVDAVVRGLELVVDAAWSRAEVHGRAERLAALEAATRAVAAELDIDRVLRRHRGSRPRPRRARATPPSGSPTARGRIERFITSGISRPRTGRHRHRAAAATASWASSSARAQTVRPTDITAHPGRYGFPPNHPVMHSFLGAPVS